VQTNLSNYNFTAKVVRPGSVGLCTSFACLELRTMKRIYEKPTFEKRDTLQAVTAQVPCVSPFLIGCGVMAE